MGREAVERALRVCWPFRHWRGRVTPQIACVHRYNVRVGRGGEPVVAAPVEPEADWLPEELRDCEIIELEAMLSEVGPA